jgi:hypothetical protein
VEYSGVQVRFVRPHIPFEIRKKFQNSEFVVLNRTIYIQFEIDA